MSVSVFQPPSGGCVLKQYDGSQFSDYGIQPPSGGCVLKLNPLRNCLVCFASRLQAAVC